MSIPNLFPNLPTWKESGSYIKAYAEDQMDQQVTILGSEIPVRYHTSSGYVGAGAENVFMGQHGYTWGQTDSTGHWWEWDFALPATPSGKNLKFDITYSLDPAYGKVDLALDGTTFLSLDTYWTANLNWANLANNLSSLNPTRPAKHTVRITSTGKNASATAWWFLFFAMSFYFS